MAKVLTITSPEVAFDSVTAQYVLTVPDTEDGHGDQVFRAPTVEALASKLGISVMHGTAKIRELNRKLQDVRGDYEICRDVANMLTALLLIKHASGDEAAKALDKMIRSLAKDLTARLPNPPEESEPKK